MKLIRAVLAIVGALIVTPAQPANQVWTPTNTDIDHLEAKLRASRLPKPLETAHRRYSGIYAKDRREVVGQYDWSEHPGIEIVQDGQGIRVMDGGCSVYNVWYDADADQIIRAMCGGR